MKTILRSSPLFLLLLVTAFGAIADAPRVGRPLLRSIEKNLNDRIGRIWPDNPLAVVGPARGVYLDGYGAVFTLEVNSAAEGISLMHTTLTAADKDRIHRLKMERVPQLKKALQEALVDAAASLDPVPADEQIVMEVDLDRYVWEAAGGYPAELLLQAPKRKLLDVKQAKGAGLDQAIRIAER